MGIKKIGKKLFGVTKKTGLFLMENMGSEFPNSVCTEEFQCHDCGLTWYLPRSVKGKAKIITAVSGYECTKGDGKKHWMWRVGDEPRDWYEADDNGLPVPKDKPDPR